MSTKIGKDFSVLATHHYASIVPLLLDQIAGFASQDNRPKNELQRIYGKLFLLDFERTPIDPYIVIT